ncbi:MAG: hypothetical protein ACE5EM_12280, partial [Sphingomonadales bacterium]
VTRKIGNEIEDTLNVILKNTRAETPRSDIRSPGYVHLKDAIGVKMARDRLSGRVGWSTKVIGKKLWRKAGWRARFFLFGTKGGVILSGRRKGARIPPQAGNDTLGRAIERNVERFFNRVKAASRQAFREGDLL